MNKFNKVLSIILITCLVLSGSAIAASAATGESVITAVKNIVDKWFVNGVEVTEAQYTAIAESEIDVEDIIIEHHLNTGTVYKINGVIVTEAEALAYVDNGGKKLDTKSETPEITSTYTFTASDLTGLNSGTVGDYLTFETDGSENIIGATVKSDKIVSVTFTYSSAYLSHCTCRDEKYTYTSTTCGVVYQDVNEAGHVFKCGSAESLGFDVADVDGKITFNVSKSDYVFKFINEPENTPISFTDVFASITLNLTK